MSDFYTGLQSTALNLITEFGIPLTLRRKVPGTYDPVLDTDGAATEITQEIRCVVLPASKGTIEAFDNRLVGDTLIETKLRALKIAAKGLTFVPAAGDTLEHEGSTWTLLGCTPSSPAGIPLVYNAAMQK